MSLSSSPTPAKRRNRTWTSCRVSSPTWTAPATRDNSPSGATGDMGPARAEVQLRPGRTAARSKPFAPPAPAAKESGRGPGASDPAEGLQELLDGDIGVRSKEHTSELQSRGHLVCRLL